MKTFLIFIRIQCYIIIIITDKTRRIIIFDRIYFFFSIAKTMIVAVLLWLALVQWYTKSLMRIQVEIVYVSLIFL